MITTTLKKVISGGQTGADVGGVLAARLHGLKTGGWMPNGWKTLNGACPEYAKLFHMKELGSWRYADRTWANIRDSDGTIRIAVDFDSAGEKCTLNGIQHYQKPFVDIPINKNKPAIFPIEIKLVVNWIKKHQIETLNVAGNSHKTWEGMQHYTTQFLSYIFMSLGFSRRTLPKEYSFLAVKSW